MESTQTLLDPESSRICTTPDYRTLYPGYLGHFESVKRCRIPRKVSKTVAHAHFTQGARLWGRQNLNRLRICTRISVGIHYPTQLKSMCMQSAVQLLLALLRLMLQLMRVSCRQHTFFYGAEVSNLK